MNTLLIIGALLSGLAALLHVGCIIYGAPWYRFFGAGEEMAIMAEQGNWRPHAITFAIVLVLSAWSAYALSGAGVIPPLPLLKYSLVAITAVYLLRGIAGFVFVFVPITGHSVKFAFWSSMICTVFGLVYLIGLRQVWPTL